MARSPKRKPHELVALHPRVRYWLELLAGAGLEHLRPETRELLEHGARSEDIQICTRGAELSLKGIGSDLSKSERRRLAEAPEALKIAVLYHVGESAPKPTYLGTGSGWSFGDQETGLAWSPGSGVDAAADRRVRLSWRPVPLPIQLELDWGASRAPRCRA